MCTLGCKGVYIGERTSTEMQVKIKHTGLLWDSRWCVDAGIDDLLIKQDPAVSDAGTVQIFLRGAQSSGILELSILEARRLVHSLQSGIGLLPPASSSDSLASLERALSSFQQKRARKV